MNEKCLHRLGHLDTWPQLVVLLGEIKEVWLCWRKYDAGVTWTLRVYSLTRLPVNFPCFICVVFYYSNKKVIQRQQASAS